MVEMLDIAVLDRRIRESLDLLRDRYAPSPLGGGGWYHELDTPEPGSTATAVGLLAFTECGQPFENFDDALAFLKLQQASSDDKLRDGGWPTKTSLGRPVVEATAWIARFLARAGCGFAEDAPDLERAYQWLVENQNSDGGWGSMRGTASRVWLTCLALRALVPINPREPAIGRGVDWLKNNRVTGNIVWGEVQNSRPTVTHTAFALVTLAEARPHENDSRLLPAYDWLIERLTGPAADQHHTWIETYNVVPTLPGPHRGWRLALWHYGLPVALQALLRDPRGAPPQVVQQALRRIVGGGVGAPPWRDYPIRTTSLWSVWWVLEGLSALRRVPLFEPGDALLWREEVVVVQRAAARDTSLNALLPGRRFSLRRLVRRHWTGLLLASIALAGLTGIALDLWGWRDFWMGVLVPIALALIQEAYNRRRPPIVSG